METHIHSSIWHVGVVGFTEMWLRTLLGFGYNSGGNIEMIDSDKLVLNPGYSSCWEKEKKTLMRYLDNMIRWLSAMAHVTTSKHETVEPSINCHASNQVCIFSNLWFGNGGYCAKVYDFLLFYSTSGYVMLVQSAYPFLVHMGRLWVLLVIAFS